MVKKCASEFYKAIIKRALEDVWLPYILSCSHLTVDACVSAHQEDSPLRAATRVRCCLSRVPGAQRDVALRHSLQPRDPSPAVWVLVHMNLCSNVRSMRSVPLI